MKEINKYPLTGILYDRSYLPFGLAEVGRYKINYTKNKYLNTALFIDKMKEMMSGTHDYRREWEFGSWHEYWKKIELISNFTDK